MRVPGNIHTKVIQLINHCPEPSGPPGYRSDARARHREEEKGGGDGDNGNGDDGDGEVEQVRGPARARGRGESGRERLRNGSKSLKQVIDSSAQWNWVVWFRHRLSCRV